MSFQISEFEVLQQSRSNEHGVSSHLTTATINLDSGSVMRVSRWSDEVDWVVDSIFLPNGRPHFVHASGERDRALKVLRFDASIAQSLTEMSMAKR